MHCKDMSGRRDVVVAVTVALIALTVVTFFTPHQINAREDRVDRVDEVLAAQRPSRKNRFVQDIKNARRRLRSLPTLRVAPLVGPLCITPGKDTETNVFDFLTFGPRKGNGWDSTGRRVPEVRQLRPEWFVRDDLDGCDQCARIECVEDEPRLYMSPLRSEEASRLIKRDGWLPNLFGEGTLCDVIRQAGWFKHYADRKPMGCYGNLIGEPVGPELYDEWQAAGLDLASHRPTLCPCEIKEVPPPNANDGGGVTSSWSQYF